MNSLEFLQSAKRLLQPEAVEVDRRNAISRAYYAVFHTAKLTADQLSWPLYNGSTHERLSQRYADNGQNALGYRLKDLHRHRVKADYRLRYIIQYSEGEKQIASCEDVLKRISALRA